MDATTFVGHLQSLVTGATFEAAPSVDVPTVVVPREHIVETCRAMRDAQPLSSPSTKISRDVVVR